MTAAEQARFWLEQEPLFLDTETTGLGLLDEVIQVALVDSQGNSLLYSLARPTHPIPPEVTAIHHISDYDVRDAPTGADVLRQLAALIAGKLVCIYNADFDNRLLKQTAYAWEMTPLDLRSVCVMRLYAQHAAVWDGRHGNYRWHKLSVAARDCRLGDFQCHDALADARITAKLLQHIAGVNF